MSFRIKKSVIAFVLLPYMFLANEAQSQEHYIRGPYQERDKVETEYQPRNPIAALTKRQRYYIRYREEENLKRKIRSLGSTIEGLKERKEVAEKSNNMDEVERLGRFIATYESRLEETKSKLEALKSSKK